MLYFKYMKISIAEKSFLKIETDKFVVYYNFSRECKKIPQCNVFIDPYAFRCDIVDKNIFLIDSPGEYEIKDLFIKGINAAKDTNKQNPCPTTFLLKYDQVKMLVCDKIKNNKTISENLKNFVSEVDVTVMIIGEKDFLSPQQAQSLSSMFLPSIVVPVSIDNNQSHLKSFISASSTEAEKQKKLKLKKKDLVSGESKVVLIQ